MADWAWKPTRQPARSPATAVVTTTIGGSSDTISESKPASGTAGPLVAQEDGVVGAQHVFQGEVGQLRARREHRDRERVTAHHRGNGQAKLVEVTGHHQLGEQRRSALAQDAFQPTL